MARRHVRLAKIRTAIEAKSDECRIWVFVALLPKLTGSIDHRSFRRSTLRMSDGMADTGGSLWSA